MKSGKFVCLVVCAVVCLMVALIWATLAPAQTFERGEIRGTVYDQQHSPVPRAKVTLSNPSTGYKREFKTDESGGYIFTEVPPGTYELRAEAENLAPIVIKDITVNIGASLSLDVTLPVKGQATTVTVSAVAAPVDTTTAGVSQLINQRNVENLPLSGRDYRDLAQLSSTAQIVPGLRGGVRLGGQQSDYSQLVIDGQDSYNNFFGEFFGSLETKNFTIPLDSVQEFQVVNNGFAPEFGRATGGLINVVTKSGTNDVHGTFHYNARSKSIAAEDALHVPLNIDLQQQFGGTFGFPIHKDRQFLFLATDIQREHGPLTTQFCPPGPGFTLCESLISDPANMPVFNPNPNPSQNILPTGCKTNTGSVLMSCFGVSTLHGLEGPQNQFQNLFTLLGHYDYQISPANHFSIRGYGTRNHTSGFTGGRGQSEIQAGFGDTENFINQGISGVFGLTTVLGRKVNEVRVAIEGETRKRHPNQANVPQLVINESCHVVTTPCPATDQINLSATIGQRFFLPINNDNGKLQVSDTFQITWGRHDIKFGGDVDSFADRKDRFVGWSAGEYDFASLMDFKNNKPCNTATAPKCSYSLFVQGFGLNGQDIFKAGTLFPAYQTGYGAFWQDKWQIARRLTLTYGLRWDASLNPQPQTPFPISNVLAGQGSGSRVIPIPQRVPNDFEQFGPRIGMAWDVGTTEHPTIVRGAWGLYYAQIPGIFLPTPGGGKTTQIFTGNFFPFVPGLPPPPQAGAPYLYPSNFFSGAFVTGSSPTYVDPNFRNPRISNLTAGVEHTLMRDLTVSGTFTWAYSWRLRTGGFNEEAWARNFTSSGTDGFGRAILTGSLDPTLGAGTDALGSFSHGNYEAFTLNATKRFSRHFQMFANYTWSQNKDNASSERDTDTFYGPQDPLNLNLDYGRNSLDITHQFKAAGLYDLPWGFTVSGLMTAHSGEPFPVYINVDVNGDGVSNSGFNNDRPSVQIGSGKAFLLGRYPLNQPNFFNWDARLMKDFAFKERYHAQLQADFFNLTNRGNLYSDPHSGSVSVIDYTGHCTARSAPQLGFNCTPLTAIPTPANTPGLRAITSIAPLATPFSFQAGFKFIF